MPILQKLSDVTFDGGVQSVARYADAIVELDLVQQKAVLSASGLKAKQADSVISMYNAALAAKMQQVELAEILGVETTDQLTASTLLAAVANGKLTQEQFEAIVSTNAQAAANTAAAGTFKSMGAAAKAAGAAMLATPMGLISLALTILPLVAKGIGYVYDRLVETAEEARETADELHSVFEETTSQLENLNSELETSKDRLKELQSLSNAGTITLVEQEELNNLREEVALLERRKDVLEEQAANDAKNANETLEHAFRKQKSQSSSEHDDIINFMFGKNNVDLFKPTYEEYISKFLESYKAMDDLDLSEMSEEQIAYFDKLRAELVNVASDLQKNWIDQFEGEGEFKDELERIFNSIYKEINPAEYFTGSLESLPKALSEKLSELGSKGELTGESVSALAEDFTELSSWMEDSMYTADEVAAHFNALSRAQAEAGDSSGVYSAQLSELTDVMSELKSSYDILESAQSDMANGGGLSADTIKKLADAEENYLDYLYEENGVVKLNTEAWKENANAKMLGEMDEIQKEIDSLEERNNALRESIQYYHEQQVLGNDGGLWSGLIAQATVEIEENNKAIAENQGKLAIYSSLYGSIIKRALKRLCKRE